MSERACHYCASTTEELRPYGPGGARVCFVCAMATPERAAEAERRLAAKFDEAESKSRFVMIGGEDGPSPMIEVDA